MLFLSPNFGSEDSGWYLCDVRTNYGVDLVNVGSMLLVSWLSKSQ